MNGGVSFIISLHVIHDAYYSQVVRFFHISESYHDRSRWCTDALWIVGMLFENYSRRVRGILDVFGVLPSYASFFGIGSSLRLSTFRVPFIPCDSVAEAAIVNKLSDLAIHERVEGKQFHDAMDYYSSDELLQ